MRDDCPISRNLEVKQGVFFTACEKRGLSVAALAAAIDIPATTMGSYRPLPSRKASLMPLAVFIKLAASPNVPTDLTSLLIEDSTHQLAPIDPSNANWLGLGMRAATFASKVCEFQSTGGHIDHREEAELREDMLVIISEGHGAVAGGQSSN